MYNSHDTIGVVTAYDIHNLPIQINKCTPPEHATSQVKVKSSQLLTPLPLLAMLVSTTVHRRPRRPKLDRRCFFEPPSRRGCFLFGLL